MPLPGNILPQRAERGARQIVQTGPPGKPGTDGADGKPGPEGKPGRDGHVGPAGRDGRNPDIFELLPAVQKAVAEEVAKLVLPKDGAPGRDGKDGVNGLNGERGAEGQMGPAGLDGAAGPVGPAGPVGANGNPGRDGAEGREGKPGPSGPCGPVGPAISCRLVSVTEVTSPWQPAALSDCCVNLFVEGPVDKVVVAMSATEGGSFRQVSKFTSDTASGTLLVPAGYWVKLLGVTKATQTLWHF